jgi:hypothetical protein
MTDGADAAWGRYVRECFVARQTPAAEPPPPPPGSADNPDEPSWALREDLALLRLVAEVPGLEAMSAEALDQKLAEDPTRQILAGRRQAVLRRAPLLSRFGTLLLEVLPVMSLEGWYGCRDLLPKKTKDQLLNPLLLKAKRTGPKPSVKINRALAMGADSGSAAATTDNSILAQVYRELGQYAQTSDIFRGSDHWFSVTFEGCVAARRGRWSPYPAAKKQLPQHSHRARHSPRLRRAPRRREHASDAGGVFRETVSNMSDDLMSERTPLFIPTPNQIHEQGDMRDMYMPNPACDNYEMFEFVGRLMAGAVQSEENIVVLLSPFIWRRIAGAPCTTDYYVRGVSVSLRNYLSCAAMDAETFEFCCNTYAVERSDGVVVELVPGGKDLDVRFEDREAWLELVTAALMGEVDPQCAAIRRGLLSAAIPMPFVALTSQEAFERAITGDPDISVEALKKHTTINVGDEMEALFWQCVEEFDVAQRSLLLKFCTGRVRLPVRERDWPYDILRLGRIREREIYMLCDIAYKAASSHGVGARVRGEEGPASGWGVVRGDHGHSPPFSLGFGFRGGFRSRPYNVSGGFGMFRDVSGSAVDNHGGGRLSSTCRPAGPRIRSRRQRRALGSGGGGVSLLAAAFYR